MPRKRKPQRSLPPLPLPPPQSRRPPMGRHRLTQPTTRPTIRMFGIDVRRLAVLCAAVVFLSSCASTAIDDNFKVAHGIAKERMGVEVEWLTTQEARDRGRESVSLLLEKPISSDDAVRIALAHNPAVQAMLFESAAESANITQSARLPNPLFTFERMLRTDAGIRELEITRTLAVSLFDLILLPARLRLAGMQQEQVRYRIAGDLVQATRGARQAWVRAVAAQQSLQYFAQVKATADASSELARRMQAVGNFSKLQRAREQAFAADAVAQYARAQQVARSTREALIRALGLNDDQTRLLKLPERLPDLPAAPLDQSVVFKQAMDDRLDVKLARARLASTAQEQGLTTVTGFIGSFEIAALSKRETGLPVQKGYEFDVPLPIFDWGDATRARAQAAYSAALARAAQLMVDASSQVREAYDAYRTADDLARHYRDEVVPLRKIIAEENVLRYNGMFIGVFELLADAREQISSVVQAIDAQRDFWLANANLQAAMVGHPLGAAPMPMTIDASRSSASQGH